MKQISKSMLSMIAASFLVLSALPANATLVISKVWVGERTQATGRILGYDANGTLLHQTDDPDSPILGFNKGFTALDLHPTTGDIYATTTEHHGMLTYSAVDGSYIARVIGFGSSNQPQDIELQLDGTVFLANQNAVFQVNRHTDAGGGINDNPYTTNLDGQLANGVTIGPDGRMYVTSVGTGIFVYSLTEPTATFEGTYATASGSFAGRPVWHNGSLYYSRSHDVYVVDPNTLLSSQFTDTAEASTLAYPNQFEFGPDGLLYVTSAGSGEVLRFDGTTGAIVDTFASGLSSPAGLVLEIIPEPSVVMLFGAGIVLLATLRRRIR